MNGGYVLLDLSEYVVSVSDGRGIFTLSTSSQNNVTLEHAKNCLNSGKPVILKIAYNDGFTAVRSVIGNCYFYYQGGVLKTVSFTFIDSADNNCKVILTVAGGIKIEVLKGV